MLPIAGNGEYGRMNLLDGGEHWRQLTAIFNKIAGKTDKVWFYVIDCADNTV